MNHQSDLLFSESDLNDILRSKLQSVAQEVDSIEQEQFKQSSEQEIIDHLLYKLNVLPLELHKEQWVVQIDETKVSMRNELTEQLWGIEKVDVVPGTEVRVTIPFTGDEYLWKYRPSSLDYNPPSAKIHKGVGADKEIGQIEIVLTILSSSLDDTTNIKSEVDSSISKIQYYLDNIRTQVESFNEELHSAIRVAIESRRSRLGKYQQLIQVLNIPLKRKAGVPDIEALPIKRRLVRPLPAVKSAPSEPGVSDKDYDHILAVIRHEGRTFEATPKWISLLGEEGLRDIIVAHLNGHYQGDATGETFRGAGKTDIRIEDKNRAAFVAECKVWHGKTEMLKAIDQLLGYLTWRDCKGALILFNKNNAKFSEIQEKTPEAINEHPNTKRQIETLHAGEWRFELKSATDPNREITLHVFLFDLYVSGKEESDGS